MRLIITGDSSITYVIKGTLKIASNAETLATIVQRAQT